MLSIDCNGCGSEFEMPLEHTTVHVYDEVEYNHLDTRCTKCGRQTILFFDDPHMVVICEQIGYAFEREQEADDNTKAIYDQIKDLLLAPPSEDDQPTQEIEVIKTEEELTPRQEQLVLDLHKALDETPIDLLMDVFEHPPPKSDLPQRWK